MPEFREIWTTPDRHLGEVTARVIAEALQADASEAPEESGTASLPPLESGAES